MCSAALLTCSKQTGECISHTAESARPCAALMVQVLGLAPASCQRALSSGASGPKGEHLLALSC